MRATFRPSEALRDLADDGDPDARRIEILVVDEGGHGVELRFWSDGTHETLPLTRSVDDYRRSPLWEEVPDGQG